MQTLTSKSLSGFLLALCFFCTPSFSSSQDKISCASFSYLSDDIAPDLGIIIYSADAETVWNALRFANLSRGKGQTVFVFLLGKGVDGFQVTDNRFDVAAQAQSLLSSGGSILACATCVKVRGTEEVNACTVSSLDDMFRIVNKSKKLLTF